METTNNQPEIKTLVDAVRYFSDLNVAHDFFVRMRWPNGPICPRCGSGDVAYLAKYRRFQCSSRHDARQFTVKTGTVMEDSPMGLDKWGVAPSAAMGFTGRWASHKSLHGSCFTESASRFTTVLMRR
jgi:transposase-like protein